MNGVEDRTPETLYLQGRNLLADGNVEAACDALCRAVAACPETLEDLAGVFGRPDDRKEAVERLERSADSSDDPAACFALAARLARDLGRIDDALRLAGRATDASPDCAEWWFERGEANLALGRTREAASAYRRCLALAPHHELAQTGFAAARRGGSTGLARWLARFRSVRGLLRRIAWSRRPLDALEQRGSSAAAHQMRLARALEHGSALSLFVDTPPGMEPENFAKHLENCRCTFWEWYLSLGVDGEVRRVLDVGCGAGYTTEHFVRHGCAVTGVTVSSVEKAECERRGIEIVEADFHYLPLPDGKFDLVFSSHSLEHTSAPFFALWDWKRVLRPGGYVLIVVPLPIDQDARAVFPDNYNPDADCMDFPPTEDKVLSHEEICTASSTYGAWLHVFVLSCRQLRWLFHLTGFELVAEAVEDPVSGNVLGIEHVDGRLPRDPDRVLNGMFLLRKPGEPATSRAEAG